MERPLPKPPLPREAAPEVALLESLVTLHEMQHEELKKQTEWQSRMFYKLRDIWIIAILPAIAVLLWLVGVFFSNIK